MGDLIEEYRKPHKAVVFWFKVSQILVANNCTYSAMEAKSQWKKLESTYRAYNIRRLASGSGHVAWSFFKPLEPLMADNTSVQARKTFSAGAAYGSSVNHAMLTDPFTPQARVGRARVASTNPAVSFESPSPTLPPEPSSSLSSLHQCHHLLLYFHS